MISKPFLEGDGPAKNGGVEARVGELCEQDQELNGLAPILFILNRNISGLVSEEINPGKFNDEFNLIDSFYL